MSKVTNIDFDKLTLDEIEDIQKRASEAAVQARAKKRDEAISAVEKTAQEHGFTLAELVRSHPSPKKSGIRVAPKYRHPENPDLTWTGRGRKPKWVVELKESGTSLEECLIQTSAKAA